MGHNLGIMTHKILLLGANGQVGHALQTTLKPLGEVVCCTRAELDLSTLTTQPAALADLVQQVKPTIIVNASAYTAVDRAEAEPELAMLLNAQVPGWLGAAAQAVGACVVHYSTDYVFDGKKAGAYTETDQTNPLSVYGRSKLDGERLLSQHCNRSIVLRTRGRRPQPIYSHKRQQISCASWRNSPRPTRVGASITWWPLVKPTGTRTRVT
jgi:dTDP-4-dehydrorhamnose reductase